MPAFLANLLKRLIKYALPIACIPCLFVVLFTPDLSIIGIINILLTKILGALYPVKAALKSV